MTTKKQWLAFIATVGVSLLSLELARRFAGPGTSRSSRPFVEPDGPLALQPFTPPTPNRPGAGRRGTAATPPPNPAPTVQANLPNFGTPAGNAGILPAPNAPSAMLPAFSSADPKATLAGYLKQIMGGSDRIPTLQDYQKLVDMKLPNTREWLCAPMGEGHFVMAMCLDQQNNLYAGTEGEGLFRFSPATGTWTQFVATRSPPPDGNPPIPATAIEVPIGDDYVYALACDHQNRIWIGHLNHGISVFIPGNAGILPAPSQSNAAILPAPSTGQFQLYEVVAGLSRPDSLNGPLGERIFHITVAPDFPSSQLPITNIQLQPSPTFHDQLTGKDSPIAGSVWICTSAGLSVYFPSTNTWSYLTRADGLPSDQANSLAFANDGTLFLATQCDGIAIANPADHYQSWRQVTTEHSAPFPAGQLPITNDQLPTTPSGSGLPSNLINDLLTTQDGTIYAATSAGLAWSTTSGNTWQFTRGKDYAAKVKGRIAGTPAGWKEEPTAVLSEDNCTALAMDTAGNLHVAHRNTGQDTVPPNLTSLLSTTTDDYQTSLLSTPDTSTPLTATYGTGLAVPNVPSSIENQKSKIENPPPPAPFPKSADPLPPTAFAKLATPGGINPPLTGDHPILYLGQDWSTQGDWVGRYGRKLALLCAANTPQDHEISYGLPAYHVTGTLAYKPAADSVIRDWCWAIQSPERRVPWDPMVALRRPSGWDDKAESLPLTTQGPGLAISVKIPAGVHRIALYFLNYDGQTSKNRLRDFILSASLSGSSTPSARTRVRDFYNGLHQQFAAQGPGTFTFTIDRNHSFNTMLSSVFIDKWSGPSDPTDAMSIPWMGNLPYASPKVSWQSSPLAKVPGITATLKDFDTGKALYARPQVLAQLLRYGQSQSLPAPLLENLRWSANLWSMDNRATFDKTMLDAWQAMQKLNPDLKLKKWRPNSPFTL